MKPYNKAVNVFAGKFHTVFIKAEQDGTLRTDIHEEKLFISSMYIMLIMHLIGVMNGMIKQEVENENSEHILKPLRGYCESVQQGGQ